MSVCCIALYLCNNMKKIYCLSGLGADEKIFMKLRVKNTELVHISWPDYDEHDELPCYAQKVAAMLPDNNPILLGVSLGGMIGVEVCKIKAIKKLILISSAKTKSEMPPYDGLFGKLMKSKVLPTLLYKMPNMVLMEKFGVESDEDEAMLKWVLRDSDGRFMKWAMRAIALWENETYIEPVAHIHGRQDKMILAENVSADEWIEDGGHMMIYNRADIVSRFIEREIEKT